MRSEWFNPVLSPIRRQHWIKSFWPHSPSFLSHSIQIIYSLSELDWNELGWEWMRSEWFNPVLSPIRRQHTIKSFWPHSPSFLSHSIHIRSSLSELDWNELGWDWMRSEWFNPVLSPIRRQHWIKSFWPHFPPFRSHSIQIRTSLSLPKI